VNKRTALALFYILVTLFAASDTAIIIAMVWYSLDITKSTFLVGVTLCISTIVPFIFEKWLSQRRATTLGFNRLLVIRLIAFISISISVLIHLTDSVPGFLLIAFTIGMADYFTISTLESQNTKLFLAGMIDSDKSSRFMQTAVQIGAFGGAFFGGWSIDNFPFTITLTMICSFAIFSLGMLFIPQVRIITTLQREISEKPEESNKIVEQSYKLANEIFSVILGLGMIGFHISAFNSLVPIVFQQLNMWSATSFGIASGLAGVGAFLAAIIPRFSMSISLFLPALIIMDIVLVYSPWPTLACFSAFFIGFFLNHIRIRFRQYLTEHSCSAKIADELATKSAFFYLLFSGSAPMILTLLTTNFLFGINAARPLMVVAALALGLAVSLWSIMSNKTYQLSREDAK
jgi:hypothetical protein